MRLPLSHPISGTPVGYHDTIGSSIGGCRPPWQPRSSYCSIWWSWYLVSPPIWNNFCGLLHTSWWPSGNFSFIYLLLALSPHWWVMSCSGQGIKTCFWKRGAARLGAETWRIHRHQLRRPCEKPHLCHTNACNVSPRQVHGCLILSTQSTGRSWGITIVAMLSYCDTASIPLTYLPNVMGEAPLYPYSMLWISKRATLLRLVTTRLIMGSPTCP